jgi:pantetheine-phosphate adenylyltransferase
MKKVVYPGSFDPVTLGHFNIIERLSGMFDEVIVLVADSVRKNYMFSTDERKDMIRTEVKKFKNVKVDSHVGMTVDYAEKVGSRILVRSIRHLNDWELEVTMAHGNRQMNPRIDTLFLVTDPKLSFVNSTLVREVAINGGNMDSFVTPNVKKQMLKKLKSQEKAKR